VKALLLLPLLLLGFGFASASSRPPAVAGSFYPGDPDALRDQVGRLLSEADGAPAPARAVVVPHAGYVYSGETASRAFAALKGSTPRRIILLGPSHHAAFSGGALPDRSIEAFDTPLGGAAIDRDAVERLRADPDFQGPSRAHDPEHCLEVEVPFLQVVAPDAKIVPVLVGHDTDLATSRRMARALAELLDADTVVVVSSDFTHHGSRYGYAPFAGRRDLGDTLLAVGRSTAGRIADLDVDGFRLQVEVSDDTVCGRRPLVVLGELLDHAFDGAGALVGLTTSGHVSGSFDLSVTYAAVVFAGDWHRWQEATPPAATGEIGAPERRELLELARATLRSHLSHDASVADWFAAHGGRATWAAPAGAFVTVHNTGERAGREGRLRACMGIIEAREPVVDAIVSAAVSAAHDPRFPPLTADELDDVELEISVLSPPHAVGGPDDIEVGTHGVVLSKGGRRAVFLPQVAVEQGWDRDTMLDHLARKAGLPRDGWRRGASFEVFTAQVFSEGS
jgi:AmmeMemoRadiSam system protein B/AmmeMemoRadiSam system protein A